jgi:hypothetical protein
LLRVVALAIAICVVLFYDVRNGGDLGFSVVLMIPGTVVACLVWALLGSAGSGLGKRIGSLMKFRQLKRFVVLIAIVSLPYVMFPIIIGPSWVLAGQVLGFFLGVIAVVWTWGLAYLTVRRRL